MEARLKKFAHIVNYGSYTLAAQQLHTSQPALTVAMKKLAKELKAELFVQSARDFVLSPIGEIAYERGKALLLQEQNFLDSILQVRAEKIPIRIGAIDSLAELLASHNMFETLEKNTRVSVIVQNSAELQKLLRQGDVDIALTTEQQVVGTHMRQHSLGSERLTTVCAPHIRGAAKNNILEPFLAYNQESNTYRIIQEQLQAAGYSIRPMFYSTNPTVILQLALQGKGIAVLPESMTRVLVAQQKIASISVGYPLSRPLSALWMSERRLPPEIITFLDSVAAVLAKS